MADSYDPKLNKPSILKQSDPNFEYYKKILNVMYNNYVTVLNAINDSPNFTAEQKEKLWLYNQHKFQPIVGKSLKGKSVKFDPSTPEPIGTRHSVVPHIERIILQYRDELRRRPDTEPNLSILEVLERIMQSDLEVTNERVGGMKLDVFVKKILDINAEDTARRAYEQGLGFDDSEQVAEAERLLKIEETTTSLSPESENRTSPPNPHPPSTPLNNPSPRSDKGIMSPDVTKENNHVVDEARSEEMTKKGQIRHHPTLPSLPRNHSSVRFKSELSKITKIDEESSGEDEEPSGDRERGPLIPK